MSKKKEEKEKNKAAETGEPSKKHSHKRRRKDDETKDKQKARIRQKGKETETDLLEKNILTEEHEQLIGSQNSSDSTLNSNKRLKQSPLPPPLPPDDSRHNNSESIIRIRLPVKRQNDPQVLTSKEQQPCSSRGRIGDDAPKPASIPDRDRVKQHPCYASANIAPEHTISVREDKWTHPNGCSK